jgi:hypothetical protein
MIERLEEEPAKGIWQKLRAMQTEFMDLERSSFFFAAEEVVIRR